MQTNNTKTQEILARLLGDGMTKYQIAKILHVSWQTVHMWHKGIYNASNTKLKKLNIMTRQSKGGYSGKLQNTNGDGLSRNQRKDQ